MAELGALNSLLRSSSIDDDQEALRLADAAIKSSRAGADDQLLAAHHTKVVALLKLDRFEDALRAISSAGSRLEDQCLLEKAYALYKTGQLSDAETVLKKAQPSRGARHVAAQVAYRAEKFGDAAEIYRELLGAAEEGLMGEENDLRINLLASNAQLEWQGDGHLVPQNEKQTGREELGAFETAYNAACGCLARGDFAKAAILLKRSRDLCEASEDLGDEEKQAELVPIIVQQAYASTKLGKLEEAAALQNAINLDEYVADLASCLGSLAKHRVLGYLMPQPRRWHRTTPWSSNHRGTPTLRKNWYSQSPILRVMTDSSTTKPRYYDEISTSSNSSVRNSTVSRRRPRISSPERLVHPSRQTKQL
jgi:signal recognition particle subunit SRP72